MYTSYIIFGEGAYYYELVVSPPEIWTLVCEDLHLTCSFHDLTVNIELNSNIDVYQCQY